MKVTTKNISETKVEITVTLDKNDLQTAKEQAVARLAKEVNVQGFRKGKVPAEIAEKHINPNDLASTTADIAVRRTVPMAFSEAKKAPLMIPNVEITKFVPDETLEYKAEADILPDIKLGDFKKLKVKREDIAVKEDDIMDVISRVREAYAEKAPVKRAAKMGDEVVIDFEGSLDGVKFEGGAAKDFKLKLGSHAFIPGFEEGIVGHETGDRFDLELTFPKDYHAENLAGKLPELDDEFAKKCGPFETFDALKADIEKNLTEQNRVKADEKFKDDLVEALVKSSKVEAPAILIEDQIRFIRQDMEQNAKAQGFTLEDYLKQSGQTEEEWMKEVKNLAEKRVKASLVLQILARDQIIEVEDEIVEAKINELKEVYKKSKEALESLKNPNVRQDIKNRLTIEKTLNFLVQENTK